MAGLVTRLYKPLQRQLLVALQGGSAVAGNAPTSVNAGVDASFDLLSASPCSLSGSATGATSYLWTKVSGTPVPTFSDATAASPTVTFDVDGAVTLRLTATNAAGSTSDDVVITVTATLSALLTRMATGSRVAYWSEVDAGGETFNGGNFSQLNDLGAGGYHVAQATSAFQPPYRAFGGLGPNGSYLSTGGTGFRLSNSSIALAGGKALWAFAVCKTITPLATALTQVYARDGDTEATAESVAGFGTADATHFRLAAKTLGASTREIVTVTSPAYDTAWRLWDLRFAAGVVPVCKCNNAPTSPAFTVTGLAFAVEGLAWGSSGSTSPSEGGVYCFGLFESVNTSAGSACLSEESAIRYYVRKQTGLG